MKKLAALVLVLLLVLLGGCGDDGPKQTQPPNLLLIQPSAAPPETAATPALPTELPTNPPTEPATEHATQPPTQPHTEPPTEPPAGVSALQYGNMKAMWLSQFDLPGIYLDGNSQREKADFTARMEQVLDNVASQGFNTVFLQVRPNGDSFYPSAYFPMSAYVVGQLGTPAQYDPVEIIVDLAHGRNLSIHAWINPMRAMSEAEMELVPPEYALRQWFEDPDLRNRYIVSVNGRWYLNPAYGPVQDLIAAGAEELLTRYPFDGLHMDDYFYPTTDASFDADAYEGYKMDGGSLSLADFRRDQLSRLVQRLWELTHASGSGRIFGISPAGNLATVYESQYADVYRWCVGDGYLDYICPQVYFGLEHASFDFVSVCEQYQDLIQSDSVDLIVGMTFGKAYSQEDKWAGSGKEEWKNNKDVLARCLQATAELQKCRGVSVFCYQYFFDPLTGSPIAQTAQERENFLPVFQQAEWAAGIDNGAF